MEAVALEVAALRAQVRRLRWLLIAFGLTTVVAPLAVLRAAPTVVEAQRFRLVDAKGVERGNFMMIGDDAAFGLKDSAGNITVLISAGTSTQATFEEGALKTMILPSGVSLMKAGKNTATFATSAASAALGVNGADGSPTAVLTDKTLTINHGTAQVTLGVASGIGGILSKDSTGKQRFLNLATGVTTTK
jgi:hypothetical protein